MAYVTRAVSSDTLSTMNSWNPPSINRQGRPHDAALSVIRTVPSANLQYMTVPAVSVRSPWLAAVFGRNPETGWGASFGRARGWTHFLRAVLQVPSTKAPRPDLSPNSWLPGANDSGGTSLSKTHASGPAPRASMKAATKACIRRNASPSVPVCLLSSLPYNGPYPASTERGTSTCRAANEGVQCVLSSPPGQEETITGFSNPHAGAAAVSHVLSMTLRHALGLGSAASGTLGHVRSSFRFARCAAAPSEPSARTPQISRGRLQIMKVSTFMWLNVLRLDGRLKHKRGLTQSNPNGAERTRGRTEALVLEASK